MPVPPGLSETDWNTAIEEFRGSVGTQWVFTSDEDVALYRDAYSPAWGEPEEILVSAAIAPDSAEQVSQVLRTANRYKIPIYAIATGKNLGYGGSAPNLSGSVVLDLKRMNRVLEVDEGRHFAIVEPGVAYFDLYSHIQERGLKLMIDTPDPGWGSVIGNALDHGVGYTYNAYRDHFHSHCGMEVVLASGEIVRTGMGAMPKASTWGEYRYGFGPTVDGLFAQGNVGVVTKMGIHLMPAPDAYQTSVVTVPRRADIIPLIATINDLEHSGILGMPEYGSPHMNMMTPTQEPDLVALLAQPGGPSDQALDQYAEARGSGYWTCNLQFYGDPAVIAAQLAYAKTKLTAAIPGATFADNELWTLPLSQEQADRAHKVALGMPNMEIFSLGARSPLNPTPRDGHLWFSPLIPKTGEAVLEAQRVFMDAFRELGAPPLVDPFSPPYTWPYRAFVFIMGFPISKTDVAQNQRTREVFSTLVQVAADHGWGEYRTAPLFQDEVMATYSYNNNALLRLHETIKDAMDPNGILAAGRSGIWPQHLRGNKA
jgi:4-cresol dehydrogenase (hydroxylating)